MRGQMSRQECTCRAGCICLGRHKARQRHNRTHPCGRCRFPCLVAPAGPSRCTSQLLHQRPKCHPRSLAFERATQRGARVIKEWAALSAAGWAAAHQPWLPRPQAWCRWSSQRRKPQRTPQGPLQRLWGPPAGSPPAPDGALQAERGGAAAGKLVKPSVERAGPRGASLGAHRQRRKGAAGGALVSASAERREPRMALW
jgi:hypothetical protein